MRTRPGCLGLTLYLAFLGGPAAAQERPSSDLGPLPSGAVARMGNVRQGDGSVVVTLSADGKTLLTQGQDHVVRLWDAATGQQRASFQVPPPGVVAAALSAEGRTVTTWSGDHVLRCWDAATGKELRRRAINTPAKKFPGNLSPDGRTAATWNPSGHISVWDTATGEECRRFATFRAEHITIVFSPDGRSLALARLNGGGVHVWDLASGRTVCRFQGPHDVHSVAFSADGKTLILRSDEVGASLWEVATGKERGCLPPQGPTAVALSPDGRFAAIAVHDKSIRLLDAGTGQELRRLPGHAGRTLSLTFAADGRRLFSGGIDGTALAWDLANLGRRLPPLPLPEKELDLLWDDLARDTALAYRAIGLLARGPGASESLLGRGLRPVAPVAEQTLARLVTDLDSDRFAVRQQASEELERLGELAEPALRRVLEGKPSLEVYRRVEAIMVKFAGAPTPPKALRALRAIEALEHLGTAQARPILAALAKGAPEARLTREAQASLERLARRPVP